jgi:succinoglycan biosynthesis protein ExoU
MEPSPTIAVIIAAYNADKTIVRAIQSALAQPEVAEIWVVNDASTDQTYAVSQSCDDGSGRLHIINQNQNTGPSAARNRALDKISSTWVAVLDSDDFLLPGRMAGLLSHAADQDFVADDMYQVDEHQPNGPRRQLLGGDMHLPKHISFTEFVLSNVTQKNRNRAELGFIKPIMRRDFLNRHGLRYQENMRLGEDYELYARALGVGAKLLLVPVQGYVSVVRPNSLSGQHSEHDLLQLRECDKILKNDLLLSPVERKAVQSHYSSVDCRLQWRYLINAVKGKNITAALKTFLRPSPVPLYLVGQLCEQFMIRVIGKT